MQFITRFKEFKSTEEGRCHLKALSYTLCYAIFHFLIVFETDVPFCFGKLKVSKLSALPFRPLSLARLILSVLVFIGHKLATFFRLANAYSALVRVIYYPCSFRIVALLCHSWDFAYSFVVVFEAFHNYQLEKLAAKRARLGYSQPGYHGPRISPPVDLTQDEPSESPPPPYSASMLPSEVYLDGERPVSDFSGVGAGSSPTVNGAQSTIAGSTIAQNTVPQSTSTPANAPASVAPANVTPAIATPETNAPSLISTGNQAVVNPTSPIPAAAHHAALPHSESTHDYHYGSHHGSPLYGSYPMAHGSDTSTTAPTLPVP
ncbi:hypothetical protein JCM33374_g1870 [Metschnikowia sp. JCM 33374]|nr:hypothetical protein JCM33374_g1870 [Metschnikowia sp. JCM 33374]